MRRAWPRGTRARPRGVRRLLPRPTLRLRLTLLYGGVFLVAGAVLLTITYELVSHSPAASPERAAFVSRVVAGGKDGPPVALPPPPNAVLAIASGASPNSSMAAHGQVAGKGQVFQFQPASGGEVKPGSGGAVKPASASGGEVMLASGGAVKLATYRGLVDRAFRRLTAAQQRRLQQVADKTKTALRNQQSDQLVTLLTRSGIALGIMAILSVGLGWQLAGRALRPVRTMSTRARGISERNLHERLALEGPDDELKELGHTFDELLARLESAFESQRQFVANASHELRTPITLERTLVEVALADPRASAGSLRGTCERVLAAGERQERLIEALLTLARSQRGLESREQLDLGAVAGEALLNVRPSGTQVTAELGQALTTGDPALVERLIGNLIDNALRYNLDEDADDPRARGWVSVWTGVRDGVPTVRVSNSGPFVTEEEAATLTEPFRRLNGTRTETRGSGLGLSIVAAIARAHGAALITAPRAEGGLDVEVSFPAAGAHGGAAADLGGAVGAHGVKSKGDVAARP